MSGPSGRKPVSAHGCSGIPDLVWTTNSSVPLSKSHLWSSSCVGEFSWNLTNFWFSFRCLDRFSVFLFQEWMFFIGSGWCLQAEQGTSTWGQVLLQLLSPPSPPPPPPTVLCLDLGWCWTQAAFMRPLQTVWSRLRSATAFLLLLALAPGEQTMLFSLASKTAGTDWFLAFSCCHVGWWSTPPRPPPSTLPTTGRMGACGPLRWVSGPTLCPSTQTAGPCSSGSRPWEGPRRSGTLGVSSLWGGSTPNRHPLLVECASSIFTPQHKLPCTTATIWKLSAGGPTLTDCHLLVWIWRPTTPPLILWSTPLSE